MIPFEGDRPHEERHSSSPKREQLYLPFESLELIASQEMALLKLRESLRKYTYPAVFTAPDEVIYLSEVKAINSRRVTRALRELSIQSEVGIELRNVWVDAAILSPFHEIRELAAETIDRLFPEQRPSLSWLIDNMREVIDLLGETPLRTDGQRSLNEKGDIVRRDALLEEVVHLGPAASYLAHYLADTRHVGRDEIAFALAGSRQFSTIAEVLLPVLRKADETALRTFSLPLMLPQLWALNAKHPPVRAFLKALLEKETSVDGKVERAALCTLVRDARSHEIESLFGYVLRNPLLGPGFCSGLMARPSAWLPEPFVRTLIRLSTQGSISVAWRIACSRHSCVSPRWTEALELLCGGKQYQLEAIRLFAGAGLERIHPVKARQILRRLSTNTSHFFHRALVDALKVVNETYNRLQSHDW